MQGRDRGEVKIGYTASAASLKRRIATLQTGYPYPLCAVHTIDGTKQDEKRLHKLFVVLKLKGEWFAWTDRLEWFFGRCKTAGFATAIEDWHLTFEHMQGSDLDAFWVSESDVCLLFGVKSDLVRLAREGGKGPPFVEGGKRGGRYYRVGDIRSWLDRLGQKYLISRKHHELFVRSDPGGPTVRIDARERFDAQEAWWALRGLRWWQR